MCSVTSALSVLRRPGCVRQYVAGPASRTQGLAVIIIIVICRTSVRYCGSLEHRIHRRCIPDLDGELIILASVNSLGADVRPVGVDAVIPPSTDGGTAVLGSEAPVISPSATAAATIPATAALLRELSAVMQRSASSPVVTAPAAASARSGLPDGKGIVSPVNSTLTEQANSEPSEMTQSAYLLVGVRMDHRQGEGPVHSHDLMLLTRSDSCRCAYMPRCRRCFGWHMISRGTPSGRASVPFDLMMLRHL